MTIPMRPLARCLIALLFTSLLTLPQGCETAKPPPPLPPMGKVIVTATSVSGKYGEEGNNGSATGAAEQAFNEVLLNAGLRVVETDRTRKEIPADVTHIFRVVVNQASIDRTGGNRGHLSVEVRSTLVDAKSQEIVRAYSSRKLATSKVESDVIKVVGEVSRQVATSFVTNKPQPRPTSH